MKVIALRIWFVVLTFVVLTSMPSFLISCREQTKSETVSGKYFAYINSQKDESLWIELNSDKTWTDHAGVTGRYETTNNVIVFYTDVSGSETDLFKGVIKDGELIYDYLGETYTYKKADEK